jgi:hypothetical protein
MAANTKAGRRNGSFKRSQEAMSERSHRNKGSSKDRSYQSRNMRPDRRIYTVLISTRGGTSVYKAWEKNDAAMNAHFGEADKEGKRYFSFKDIRGKELTNVDLQAGWRYKMTLRWNNDKVARDGSLGDWQDIREWYSQRDVARAAARAEREDLGERQPRYVPTSPEEKPVRQTLADGDIEDEGVFPSLQVVFKSNGEVDEPVVKIHKGGVTQTLGDSWSDGEEEDGLVTSSSDVQNSSDTAVVQSLEAEKAELVAMLEEEE